MKERSREAPLHAWVRPAWALTQFEGQEKKFMQFACPFIRGLSCYNFSIFKQEFTYSPRFFALTQWAFSKEVPWKNFQPKTGERILSS